MRRAFLTLLVVVGGLAASGVRSRAAHAGAPDNSNFSGVTALRRAHQMGLLLIGSDDADGRVARTLVKRQLEKADHEVKVLATVPQTPHRASMAHTCLTLGIDAIALVRISTQAPPPKTAGAAEQLAGRMITLQVRDRKGERVRLQSNAQSSWTDPFVMNMVLSEQTFAAAAAEAPPPEGNAPPPVQLSAPLLRIGSDGQYLGTARLHWGEFYDLTGHPDLAAQFRRRTRSRIGVQVAGYVLLGGGLTALAGVELGVGFCSTVGAIVSAPFGGRKDDSSCKASPWAYAIPVAVAVTGGLTLILSMGMRVDPVDAEARAAMVRAYNRQIHEADPPPPGEPKPAPPKPAAVELAVAPAVISGGGLLIVNGRF